MRKAVFGIVIVLVVLAAIFFFVISSLDRIVAKAIEHYGSSVTQTDVRVSSVSIKLKSGEGTVNGLKIGNPSGFSSPFAFDLSGIRIKMDTQSVTGDPVVIEEIHVSQPRVTYEIDFRGKSNINTLKDNLQQLPKKKEPRQNEKGKTINLTIRKLVVEQGQINVHIAARSGEPLTVNLPRIELSNLGGGKGLPPDKIGKKILTVLMRDVGSAAASAGVRKYLGKSIEEVKQEMKRGVEEKVGESLGSATKETGDTLKKFLGR
jgi:hypothetical protein